MACISITARRDYPSGGMGKGDRIWAFTEAPASGAPHADWIVKVWLFDMWAMDALPHPPVAGDGVPWR